MAIVNGYCTLEELKARMQVDDTIDDSMIEDCITSACRTIDNHCERQFFQTTEDRYFEPPCGLVLELGSFNDLTTLTTLATDATGDGTFELTWAATDYELLPVNRSGPELEPYTAVRALTRFWPTVTSATSRLVKLTGVWGWADIPANVKTAALIQAQREVKQRYMSTDQTYLPWSVVKGLLARYRLNALLGA